MSSKDSRQDLAPAVQRIKAYPNPAKGMATLYFKGMATGNYQLTVLDGVGKAVRSSKIFIQGNTAKLDLSALARGFYTINVSNGIVKLVLKIVLQ